MALIIIAALLVTASWPAGAATDAFLVVWDRGRRTDGYPIGAPLRRDNWAATHAIELEDGIDAPRIDSFVKVKT
jgi:hypothetical protein